MRWTGDQWLKARVRPLLLRIARWLGADGNPLRRRTDRIEGAVRVVLVLAFLGGGPLVAGSVGAQVSASGSQEVRAESAWQQVHAVLVRRAPQPYYPYGSTATFWVRGRWQAPSGAPRTGLIPVPAGTRAGTGIAIWVDRDGRLAGHHPVTTGLVVFRVVVAEIVSLAALAIALLLLAALVRWQLDRRRMARWAVEWAMVGPRWTSRR